eukprot:TRINITY_DN5831_c0_g2_i2.p1 TRINITY_DN5831_c0_g2~~TRINITY_DN5831_c0_g2_i2.p1  ORF type:complete len:133 (+),score=18.92 TRINITY_DN5831_c0_g2_i2:278-676(+)
MTNMERSDLESLFQLYDCDHSGTITWREYICVITLIMAGTIEDRVRLIFNCFDADGNGVLTKDEFKKAAKNFSDLNGDEIDDFTEKVFRECDKNGDKEVSYKEFHNWVISHQDSFTDLVGVLNIVRTSGDDE